MIEHNGSLVYGQGHNVISGNTTIDTELYDNISAVEYCNDQQFVATNNGIFWLCEDDFYNGYTNVDNLSCI